MDAPRGAAAGFPVVAIGGSAGALEALQTIVGDLPPDFGGAIFITTHVPTDAVSALPHILGRRSPLFVGHALDGTPVIPGRILIAPPDHHLMFANGVMRVIHGPTENNSRPSIDVMFRSAASTFDSRLCGILLSGTLDDGVSGLKAIHAAGGIVMVQDPDDAQFADMPQNALNSGVVDRQLPARELVAAIESWMNGLAHSSAAPPKPVEDERVVGTPSAFTCPDCSGTLWVVDDEGMLRFRCRVGHAYSTKTMLDAQGASLEAALWMAVRALEERRDLLRRVAESAPDGSILFRRMRRKAEEITTSVEQLQGVIAELSSRESASS
jgi:two-component system, chemotaxis family, protein-glutamate methylesterase/glutaminase